MDNIDLFNADEQEGELDPNDAWLMRAAGGEDEPEDNIAAAIAPRDDDQFSFEDSERFEEDSLCSWISDTESLNQNWRGWSAARTSSALVSRDVGFVEGPCGSSQHTGHRYTGGIATGPSCQHSHRSTASSPSGAAGASSPIPSASCSSAALKSRQAMVAVQGLAEMAARCAARCYSFDALEAAYHSISAERRRMAMRREHCDAEVASLLMETAFTDHAAIPDKFFLSIVRWCFPESEEDIRLYSCLANGNADEFGRGEYLYQSDAVRDVFQIGYHLSAVVSGSISGSMSAGTLAVPTPSGVSTAALPTRQSKNAYNVSVRVDRCRIVSCSCSCAFKASWCQHVVAVCLHRIHRSQQVEYRVTIWDSINELTNHKLKKFAQFLINDLPRQYLPLAQRLIDQLRNPNSEINAAVGAPDPTDGGHEEVAIWCLDQRTLHENIRRIIVKFCVPSPTVHCDVQYLSSNQPPAASEWQSLLRPHRSKDPEGLWNLLSIVREMFKRRDENATSLLHIITEECLACNQVLIWWYQTALSQSGQWILCSPSGSKSNSLMSSQNAPQFNCASLCDEIVQLWRLAALNPRLSELEREQLASFLQIYHRNAVERIWKNIYSSNPDAAAQTQANGLIASVIDRRGERLSANNARFTYDLFPGFLPALKACHVGWDGITVEGASSGTRPTFNPNQLLTVNTSSGNSHESCSRLSGFHYSPNMPILCRHSRVSEGPGLVDIPGTSGSLYRNALYQSSSGYYSVHQQGPSRSAKRRKKTSSRVNRCRAHQAFEFHDERSLARAARAAARAVRDMALGEEMEEESAESGQESEDGPSRSTNCRQVTSAADGDESNADGLATNGAANQNRPRLPSGDVDELFARAHVQQSNWDVKFARCEALMSHGYTQEACRMAVELAEEMVERPPDLLHPSLAAELRCHIDGSMTSLGKLPLKARRRKNSLTSSAPSTLASDNTVPEFDSRLLENSQVAALTFSRTIFLVQSLMKEPETHRLAFSLALCALELPRGPAATKFLEVKLYHLSLMKEPETHRLAFSLALCALELPRGPAATKFLEVKLYHLEAELVTLLRRLEIGALELQLVRDRARKFITNASVFATSPHARVLPISLAHYILDALSYSHNVSSSCQGRRSSSGIATRSSAQRRPSDEELAVKVALEALGMKLMVSEADYPMLCESTRRQRGELANTMLMRYKDCTEKLAVVLDSLLDPTMHRMYKDHQSNAAYYLEQDPVHNKLFGGQRPQYPYHGQCSDWLRGSVENVSVAHEEGFRRQASCDSAGSSQGSQPFDESRTENSGSVLSDDREVEQLSEGSASMNRESADESSSFVSTSRRRSTDEGNDSPSEESSSSGISRGIVLEATHLSPMGSQSASAGTSKSPSPAHHVGASSSQKEAVADAPPTPALRTTDSSSPYYRLNRRKPIPNSPNQASEAQAHYMMELAKRLLIEAGGSQNTVIFNASQNIGGQNNAQHHGPHRQLHICSFLVGLYALGLNNLVSTSWQTRTYSTNVSWIHGQAIEIGCAAIKIVERVWEAHLTPTEVAALADKASQSRDPGMVEAAAKLALSVLPKAYALTAAESQKALHQCKEQSSEMLEKACKAVEQAAEKDGVYPEVLFKVARHWYELFCESDTKAQQPGGVVGNAPLPPQSALSHLPTNIAQSQPPVDGVPSQMHQGLCAGGPMVQVPVQYAQLSHTQQMPFQQASYYRFPSQHPPHPTGISHRPAVFLPPVTTAQQQLIIPYGPRGPLPSSALPINSSLQMGPASSPKPTGVGMIASGGSGGAASRSLHVSHSAPSLTPLQAVHISRRAPIPPSLPQPQPGQQSTATAPLHPSHIGGDHTVQVPIPMNAPPPPHHHHINASGSLMHCSQMVPTPPHLVQPGGAQVSGVHHGASPNSAMQLFHHQATINAALGPPGGMIVGDPRMVKLVHAHRVGMKALETMGNRNHDDNRSYAKFSQNPAYAEDVRWLFSIAVKLGGVFTQSFCEVAARSIASPFVLFSLAVESTKVFHWQVPQMNYHSQALLHPIVRSQMANSTSATKHNHAPQVRSVLMQSGFAAPTAELMQHCVEMFYMAASSKLSHPRFVASDTEEVIQLVKTARDAFYWIPGPGKLMFDDFMRHVRKQKACKKDVAQRINACIQQAS
ncbi:Zinc finger SWIM domain-containing protein 8 [Toxocara canis]|uniref:Zinc finger SWIM domain-containing protein 8 n=1 Tax=Toxocara canis TaxID=6265 RepID=A0A0B2W1X7_TOXCA|nr:Zinc finger SWIM domain-containing protein 8 [Toxocara canis]